MATRILVADDDADIRDFLEFVLDRAGHEVTLAADGVEVLEHVAGSTYDLALIDHHMPRMTGLDAARVLAEQHPQMPVLLMSGDTDVGRKHAPFLAKPFNRGELLAAIDELVALAPPGA